MPRGARDYASLVALLVEQNQFAIKYDLDAMREAMASEGLQHAASDGATVPGRALARRLVLVGGTNGKGTTSAMLAAAALHAGLKVGLYTSPHLVDVRERVRVDAAPLSREEFAAVGWELMERYGGRETPSAVSRPLSYFELLTLLAARVFAEADLDLAVVEVGLGGRLDATNVFCPDVSVLTSVSLDHQAYLGDSETAIAREKVPICRPGRPVILHRRAGGFEELVGALGALAPTSVPVVVDEGATPREWAAALAVAAASQLREPTLAPRPSLELGAARARWPGRQQVVERGRIRVLVDGAHNAASIAACAAWMSRELPTNSRIPVVLGVSGGRDAAALARPIAPFASELIAVTTENAPCAPSADVARALRPLGVAVSDGGSVGAGVRRAAVLAESGSAGSMLVTGSLYVVGEALESLGFDADSLSVFE
ncbi:MAG: hypothetical protein H6698_01765 [Myxococcales bacterium]|nr:hypothetical protein [Myxococcales bacterium]MCB9532679.1 hypothetical protein [Myxococcales bacterium]MCB9533037.1 hypothetical protein [Myxococcales bacterium]